MNTNPMVRHEHTLIAQHAADWLRRLQSDDITEHAAFIAWLRQSPLHVQEMLLAMAVEDALEGMDAQRRIDLDALVAAASGNVVPLRIADPAVAPVRNKPSTRWRWIAGAAAAVLLVVALGLMLPASLGRTQYATELGEQRAVSLDDGSLVYLNTLSRVRTNFSATARDIYLLEGQAMFRVTHDADRPFRVHTDTAVIQAIGTQFDVRRLQGRTEVAVIEGVVKVSTAVAVKVDTALPTSQKLAAGQATAVSSTVAPVPPPHTADVKDIMAWQQRRLVFRKDPLADIAEEFNRYGRVKMRIEGPALRAREFSGTFDADDPALLLSFLERDTTVVVERRGGEIYIRPRSTP